MSNNRLKNVRTFTFFDLILARISLLIEQTRISDSRRFRTNLSGLNLRSFDGATGDKLYDIVVKFESSLGLTSQNVETFVTFSFQDMAPATVEWSTMSRPGLNQIEQFYN